MKKGKRATELEVEDEKPAKAENNKSAGPKIKTEDKQAGIILDDCICNCQLKSRLDLVYL